MEPDCTTREDNKLLDGKLAAKMLRSIVRDLKSSYSIYLSAILLCALLSLSAGQLFQFFTTHLSETNPETLSRFLVQLGLLGGAIGLCLSASTYIRIVLKEWMHLKVESYLRRKVLAQVHTLPLSRLEKAGRGDWLTRVTGDVRTTEDFLIMTLPDILHSTAIVLGTIALLAYYSGPIVVLPLAAAFFIALASYKVQEKLKPIFSELRTLYSKLFQILIENLEGYKTIRSYSATNQEKARVEEKLQFFSTKGMKVARLIGVSSSGQDLFTHLLITLCLLTLAVAVSSKRMTVGQALIYPFYVGQFFFAVRGLVSALMSWGKFVISGAQLADVLRESGEVVPTLGELPKTGRKIFFEKLEVGFETPVAAFHPFSLERGKLAALQGPSGSGKSTLLETLSGLRPALSTKGYALQGTNLVPFEAKESLLPLEWCAFVEQRPYVFQGTLAGNLSLGNRSITPDQMFRVLKAVGLLREFEKRGGLSLLISERGQNVSVGQLYRIAIARALLLKRPYLLLDEPFASLDGKNVQLLVKTLNEIRASVGILVVTHYVPPGLFVDTNIKFIEKFDGPVPSDEDALGGVLSEKNETPIPLIKTLKGVSYVQ